MGICSNFPIGFSGGGGVREIPLKDSNPPKITPKSRQDPLKQNTLSKTKGVSAPINPFCSFGDAYGLIWYSISLLRKKMENQLDKCN